MIKKMTLIGVFIVCFLNGLKSQVIINEDFEGPILGFLWQNSPNNNTYFSTNTTLSHSGTTSLLDVYGFASRDTLLQSGVVDLTTAINPQLVFWHIAKMDGGADHGTVYISIDSGVTYSALTASDYLGASSGTGGFPTVGRFDEDSYPDWGTGNETPNNTWWKREAFSLAAYSSSSKVKIIFVLESDFSLHKYGWNIDDISIESVVCPAPSNLTSYGTTSDSTNVTWTSGSADTLWQIEYDLEGFVLGTGTRTAFTNKDTVSISNLTPNSTYEYYVRSICTGGDTSIWRGIHKIYTSCVTLTAPYSQNFDSMQVSSVGSVCYTIDDLNECWSNNATSTNMWAVLSGSTGSGSTGPTTDHTVTSSGLGNYIYLEASICSGVTSTAFSPILDVSSLSNPQLSFYYHMFGVHMGSLNVYVTNDNGVTWSPSLFSVSGDQTNLWKEAIISLSSYIGDTIQIKFEGETGSGERSDIAIDDILVDDVPTCPKPSAFVNYTIANDSVNLTWTNGINDSTWILEYGLAGFTLGTGTTITSTNDSITIGSLVSNTDYDVYLRSFCDVADTSLWQLFSFTTPCAHYSTPYLEDFSTFSFGLYPTCWFRAKGDLTVNSILSFESPGFGIPIWTYRSSFANNGINNNVAVLHLNVDNQEDWFISPPIDLGDGTTPYQVEFDLAITDYYNSSPPQGAGGLMNPDEKLILVISTDNGVTWSDTNIIEIWDTNNMPSHTGDFFNYNLSAAGYTGVVRFGLYGEVGVVANDNDWFIDNFAVVQVPTCPKPTALTLDSVSQTTASLSWVNGLADNSWILEYGPVGFSQGSGTTISSSTNPAVISNLTAATCYDVYLRSICAVGDTSVWIGPLNFCTDCSPATEFCEDFEGFAVNELPICWNNFISSTSSNAEVTVKNHGAYSGTNSMFFSNAFDPFATAMLISPEVTSLSTGMHRASFWMKGDSTVIVGTMSDPTDPGTFSAFDTIIPTPSYVNYQVPFDTYTGSDKYVAFLWNPSGVFKNLFIDDICIEEIPPCEKTPSVSIPLNSITANSIRLSWARDTSHTSYIIAYGKSGFDPVTNGAGGDTVYIPFTTPTTNSRVFNGLDSITEYCFWIKSICTNGDTGFWEGPYCEKSGCPPAIGLPYFTDFSDYSFINRVERLPLCWEEGVGSGSSLSLGFSDWISKGFGNVGSDGAAKITLAGLSQNEWFLSPNFDFGNDIGIPKVIEFDIALTRFKSTLPGTFDGSDTLAFVISYDGGSTWDLANPLLIWDSSSSVSTTGDHITHYLQNTVGMVKFGFYVNSPDAGTGDVFIDNFSIRDTAFAGVQELDDITSFTVYPNPNNGQFTILNEGSANKFNIKIVDIQGRIVYEEFNYFTTNSRKQIDLTKLNSGVYVLILQGKGIQEQHRIILNK